MLVAKRWRLMKPSASDATAYAIAVLLAGASVTFAGYMIAEKRDLLGWGAPIMSSEMQDPLDRTEAASRAWLAQPADPMPTSSVESPAPAPSGTAPAAEPDTWTGPPIRYRLYTVIRGTAFVEAMDAPSKPILPADVGYQLPGAGRVIALEQRRGRWVVVTTRTEILEQPK
jgi:hypothetical protein